MNEKDYTRQEFLSTITRTTLTGLGASFLVPSLASAREQSNNNEAVFPSFDKGDVIVFQGDSITDAGRDRKRDAPNDQRALGAGYAFIAASTLRHTMPGYDLKCYNKGISGNKVFQLADRWEEDCLRLNPDILSILVGVNDFWHTLSHGYDGTAEIYERDFRALLERTQKALPEVTLVIGEPYVVKSGSAVDDRWFPAFLKYQAAARRVAKDFGAAFIPYQQIYDEAGKEVPGTYWAADGVHPTTAGCHLMAAAWLETVKRI